MTSFVGARVGVSVVGSEGVGRYDERLRPYLPQVQWRAECRCAVELAAVRDVGGEDVRGVVVVAACTSPQVSMVRAMTDRLLHFRNLHNP